MKILIHSNAPWIPTGYGKQTALAARVLTGLGHKVSFSAFSGLQGQPITWQVPGIEGDAGVCAVYPGGMVAFGPDMIVANARVAAADLIVSIMDTYKLDLATRDLKVSGIPFAPFVISDSKAANGGPSTLDQAVIRDSGALPVAVSRFTQQCLQEVDGLYSPGWEVPFVPHAVDTAVYRPPKNRGKLRRELETDGQFIIGIMGANKDPMRKAYAEQFEAFYEFSKRHPEARLAVFSVYDSVGGLRLDEIAHDMRIIDKVMFMPTYEQVAGLLSEEYCAAWFSSLDILSACSYGEGFGVPALESQACGTPVVVTNWSAQAELGDAAGWLVEGEPYWNAAHRGWWKRPNVGRIIDAWEAAYEEKASRPRMWAERQKRAAEFARRYSLKAAAGHWAKFLDQVENFRDPAEGNIRVFDGLKWKVDNLTDKFGSMLALNHESWFTDNVVGDLGPGSVFVDVGAHVGHWAVRAAARGARVVAIEADPVTAERLTDNLKLNGLDAEVFALAAWDSATELHLAPQQHDELDGTNQVHEVGDGQAVKAEPLDVTLAHLDRIDRLKMDVEGADLHVLRGLRETLARTRPQLFIEDHSRYGFYERAELNALLGELGYVWDDLPHGYIVARPAPVKL